MAMTMQVVIHMTHPATHQTANSLCAVVVLRWSRFSSLVSTVSCLKSCLLSTVSCAGFVSLV